MIELGGRSKAVVFGVYTLSYEYIDVQEVVSLRSITLHPDTPNLLPSHSKTDAYLSLYYI